MITYLIKNNEAIYQQLALDAVSLRDQLNSSEVELADCVNFGLLNVELEKHWGLVSSTFEALPDFPEAIKVPNISIWKNATLVLSERAHASLKLILAEYGEFLPIYIGDYKYYIFNLIIEGKVDLEKTRYEWDDDIAMELEALVFDSDDIKEKAMFKSFHNGLGGMFCSDAFKVTCEELDLDGLLFDQDLTGAE
ncbi:MAG: hypothetical protein ACI93R_003949 [Flavobacteriales bacterium]|jgi:hypothetical protein